MTKLKDIFQIKYGNKLDMNKMTTRSRHEGIAFVGRLGGLSGRSGIAGYVAPVPGVDPYESGLLTVALGGSRLLSTYVQQRPFYTAQNVAVLRPIVDRMTIQERLYYAMCIRANAFRYSAFGREANRTLAEIEMPSSVPAWVEAGQVPTVAGMARSLGPRLDLSAVATWPDFGLGGLFEIKKGRRITKAARTPGPTRFIGASDKQNGITDMCDLDPIFPAHSLTVPYNGSVGHAFYQDKPYFASDDVNVLIPRVEMSRWVMMFIAVMIRRERFRYSYGYKWNLARMLDSTVRLPGDANGAPDWDYMEAFILGLPFTASLVSQAEKEDR